MSDPTSGAQGPDTLSVGGRVDAICDRFEAAWKAGQRPAIEDYLGELPEPGRAALLRELLELEIACREQAGERPTPTDYRGRFPEHAALIESIVETAPALLKNEAAPVRTGDPTQIGRFRVIRRLGAGAFGRVYLAHDDELDRAVAVKVPNPERISSAADLDAYLKEAKVLAKFEHPHIVPVYDVGRTDLGLCYVVSRFLDGGDLAARIRRGRPPTGESAELVATVALALHHAHTRGLVHRDIKPANILFDAAGKPYVADFGLALKEEDFGKSAGFAGTPAYMSPEQARGEGHRVDGRSDIFSLGVVFYELLTGRRPFRADSLPEIMEQVTHAEVRPPRQIDDTIPRELERICLKALSKRVAERYTTASDFAEDLRGFLASTESAPAPASLPSAQAPIPSSLAQVTPVGSTVTQSGSDQRPLKVVPKGLRSFDEHDADFFLELVPGPRNRDGLPDSIRFWKDRIEERDPEKTFRVGLIYGPSGCGKSSLVKAGLLPRLAEHVRPVYLEATPEDTEVRLLKALGRAFPDPPAQAGLVDWLTAVRRGRVLRSGQKLLLVLDQFEQWLHAWGARENAELVAALRQCDGEHLQAIVMVRDDFWMAATRFVSDLELELLQGRNTAPVDLFDPRHARKVLLAFGIAYGNLPERTRDISREQHAFLDQAITGLAQDGKVISVRLALFAEMVKGKPWTPATLRDVGGALGVGVTFLEETFFSPQANPQHRLHQRAAQAVLKALLPESGTDIKGQMRSELELKAAAGYSERPRDFLDLMHILDSELRLITPTGRAGSGDLEATVAPAGRYYQLTHDYLIHSLHDWLTRKQRETRQGRAELRLVERAALWNMKAEKRHLPTVIEWANIRLLTRERDWTEPQRRMMRKAGRVHIRRGLSTALVLALLVSLGWYVRSSISESHQAMIAAGLVEQVRRASLDQVPGIVAEMKKHRKRVDPLLKQALPKTVRGSPEELHIRLALLPVDGTQALPVCDWLLRSGPDEVIVIRNALETHRAATVPRLWGVVKEAKADDDRLLPALSALASFDPDSPPWATNGDKAAAALVGVNPIHLGRWMAALSPVRARLSGSLALVCRDRKRPEGTRAIAARILSDYARDDVKLLTRVLLDADPSSYAVLYSVVERGPEEAIALFRAEICQTLSSAASQQARDELAERQARSAIALLRLGREELVWPLLEHSTDPRLRSFILNWLNPLRVPPTLISAELERIGASGMAPPAPGQQKMDAILFNPETSMRRALIQALGSYDPEALSPADRKSLDSVLLELYRNDPDAGIHSAAEWTLRRWNEQQKLEAADNELRNKDRGERRWFVNSQGQTFALIDGPVEFRMGLTPDEPDYEPDERPHRRIIPRRFMITTKEVSVAQYRVFLRDYPQFFRPRDQGYLDEYSPKPDGPMIGVTWFAAVAYCNWLSKQEGLPEQELCYLPNKQGQYDKGTKIPDDVLKRTGYRLPTQAEWEYACRAGTVTSRYYGTNAGLLGKYAWYLHNSEDHAWPGACLLPNDLGLFDMLGNVAEWCQERVGHNDPGEPATATDDVHSSEDVDSGIHRHLRGGAFLNESKNVRAAQVYRNYPTSDLRTYGLRLARTLR